MKKHRKVFNKTSIKSLDYPKRELGHDLAVEIVDIIDHSAFSSSPSSHLHVKESGSLSLSSLLLNQQNVDAFQSFKSMSSILHGLQTIHITKASLPHIAMCLSSLHILTQTSGELRQQLLVSTESVACLFRLCYYLIHYDAELQLSCFELILLLSRMDNYILYFSQADLKKYLISKELLYHEDSSFKVTRGSSHLLFQLLLYNKNFISCQDLSLACFQSSAGTVFRDFITEDIVLRAMVYSFSCGSPQEASYESVIDYCLQSILTERIHSIGHLHLLLQCLHECVSVDLRHSDYAVDNQILSALLYASNYSHWKNWIETHFATKEKAHKSLLPTSTNQPPDKANIASLFQTPVRFFEDPPSPYDLNTSSSASASTISSLLHPDLSLITALVSDLYVTILRSQPFLAATVLSGGIIPSLLSNPIDINDKNSYYFPVIHLVHEILLLSLFHQPQAPSSIVFFQELLLKQKSKVYSTISSAPLTVISKEMANRGTDLRFICRLVESLQVPDIFFAQLVDRNSSVDCLYESLTSVGVLSLHIRMVQMDAELIVQLAAAAKQYQKLLFPYAALLCRFIDSPKANHEHLVRSDNVLTILVRLLRLPSREFTHKVSQKVHLLN